MDFYVADSVHHAFLVLFAASKDQRRYFTLLAEKTNLGAKVVWYKSLRLPAFLIKYPLRKLWRQTELLVVRKCNSRKGKHYPNWFWPLFQVSSFIQAVWLYALYVHWLKTEKAQFVGVWNGKKFRQAVLLEAIQTLGKSPIFFETGPLPGVSAIDPNGVNAFSSVPRDVVFYQNRVAHERLLVPCCISDHPNGLPLKYIFVPFQVVEDSNIYLHSPWIRNMRQLFALCKNLADKLGSDYHFVFKPHPSCDEDYSDLKQQQSEQLIFAEDISTPVLVEHADAVMTVNSTVGIEGLMAAKKVLVLGDALFAIEGISYPVKDELQLQTLLLGLHDLSVNEPTVNSFIDYLKNDYAIPGNAMKSPDKTHWRAAERRLQLLLDGKTSEALVTLASERSR